MSHIRVAVFLSVLVAGAPAMLPAQVQPGAGVAVPLTSAAVAVAAVPSGTVHVDRPRADEPTVWVRGDRYKASIDGDALTFIPFLGADAPRNQPIRLTVESVRCGEGALDATTGDVAVDGRRVTVQRAGFAEVYDAVPEGLEQSFRFDRLAARGALAITLAVTSEAIASRDGDDVLFRGPFGDVRYSKLVAVDARGARLALPIGLVDGRIRLEVPAEFVASAHLPLIVDPVLTTATVATVPDQRMEPDVAWNQQVDEHLVVWRVPYSATDWDVAAIRTDFWLNPIGTSFWIDFTSQHWEGPRVACKRLEGMFLVVGQVSSGAVAPYSVVGRRYEAIGATRLLHPQFDIQRASVVGHVPGDGMHPDVSADPWLAGGPAYFTVVWEHHLPGSNGDIYFRQLWGDGTFANAGTQLNGGAYDDRAPSISKSPGQGIYGVVWTQYNGLGVGGDIVAAEIDYSGLQVVPPFFLDSSPNDDSRPRISTPAELVTPWGLRTFLVTWQRNFDPFSNVGRLHCAAITNNPNQVLINRWDLTALLGIPGSTMAFEPVVDSDGLRFAVAHGEVQAAAPGQGRNDLYVSTLALDGTNLRVHESRAVLQNTGPHAYAPAMASRYGGSLANTRTYSIVGGTSAISVLGWVYNGHQPGPFFNVRVGGCGGLPITYAGYPTLGDSVQFTVGGTDPFKAMQIGFPAPMTSLAICPGCTFGVNGVGTVSSPYYNWNVPYVPGLVGLTLSVQGYSIGTGPCLGAIKLTDVVDFTLR